MPRPSEKRKKYLSCSSTYWKKLPPELFCCKLKPTTHTGKGCPSPCEMAGTSEMGKKLPNPWSFRLIIPNFQICQRVWSRYLWNVALTHLRMDCKPKCDLEATSCCAKRILELQPDFQAQKLLVQEVIEAAGHLCILTEISLWIEFHQVLLGGCEELSSQSLWLYF